MSSYEEFPEIVKRKKEIEACKVKAESMYVDLGREYYKQYANLELDGLGEYVKVIREQEERAALLEKEIDEIINIRRCPFCGNEDISERAVFCCICGRKIKELKPQLQEVAAMLDTEAKADIDAKVDIEEVPEVVEVIEESMLENVIQVEDALADAEVGEVLEAVVEEVPEDEEVQSDAVLDEDVTEISEDVPEMDMSAESDEEVHYGYSMDEELLAPPSLGFDDMAMPAMEETQPVMPAVPVEDLDATVLVNEEKVMGVAHEEPKPEFKICPNCHGNVNINFAFCTNCGTRMK